MSAFWMGRREGSRGWWADHAYKRRCCGGEGGDFYGYCGRDRLVEVTSDLESPTKELFSTLFLTGGRANEVRMLRGRNFSVGKAVIRVRNMRVFKKYKRDSKTEEMKLVEWFRHFPIKMTDPLTEVLLGLLERRKKEEFLFDFSYSTLYRLIAEIEKGKDEKHGPWWPHRLRAERASQLVVEYKFNKYLLKKWFQWSRDKTPDFYVYVGMADLEKAMGIEEERIPKEIQLPLSQEETGEPLSVEDEIEEILGR